MQNETAAEVALPTVQDMFESVIYQEVTGELANFLEDRNIEWNSFEHFSIEKVHDWYCMYKSGNPSVKRIILAEMYTWTCYACGERKPDWWNRSIVFPGENQVCVSCREDDYDQCYGCERLFLNDDLFFNDDDNEERLCSQCMNNRPREALDEVDENDISDTTRHRYPMESRRHSAVFLGNPQIVGEIVRSQRGYSAEIEFYATKWVPLVKALKAMPSSFGMTGDGSLGSTSTKDGKKIYKALEVQTAIMVGKEGEDVMTNVYNSFSKAGGYVDRTCGLHIHLDMTSEKENVEVIKRLFAFHFIFEDVIQSFLPKERRVNRYCLPLKNEYNLGKIIEAQSIMDIAKHWYRDSNENNNLSRMQDHRDGTRYHGINMHTLLWQGHVEIRYHSGTLNPEKMLQWANLHARIIDYCAGNLDQPTIEFAGYPLSKNNFIQTNMQKWEQTEGQLIAEEILTAQKEYESTRGALPPEIRNKCDSTDFELVKKGYYSVYQGYSSIREKKPIPDEEKVTVQAYTDSIEKFNKLTNSHSKRRNEVKAEITIAYDQYVKDWYKETNEHLPRIDEMMKSASVSIAEQTKNLFDILNLADTSREYLLSRQEKFAGQADYNEDDIEIKPMMKGEELIPLTVPTGTMSDTVCVE